MPATLSKLASKLPPLRLSGNQSGALLASGLAVGIYFFYQHQQKLHARRIKARHKVADSKKKVDKPQIDIRFFAKIHQILKILVPGWFTPESGYLILVAISLICRTYADVWMIGNGTAIEGSIIGRNMNNFKKHLFAYVYAMPAISIVNNVLKFGLNELKLRFRTRLTRHLFERYTEGYTFYKMSNIDNRIANADQILTQDVERFCESIVELYSNVSKPLLDMCLYAVKLTSAIGAQAPGVILLYLLFSGAVLTRLRRPLARMTVKEQQLEGEFRHVNSRLITNSEEIAFYQGNVRERISLFDSLSVLIDHLRDIILFRFSMGFLDNIVAKYIATFVGFFVVSRPFMDQGNSDFNAKSKDMLIQDYYKSGRMLVKLAEAVGRLALAGRELTRLAGFTQRVSQMMVVLDDLNKGSYVRTMVSSTGPNGMLTDAPPKFQPGSGEIVIKDHLIRFEHVPLVTPNGDLLVEDLNFEVRSGLNVLVCGPNGCGKSSLFRILGELWPLFGGKLVKPDKGKLFYIPQRPYMTLGTLRDQIIYPHSRRDMVARGFNDEDLISFLDLVQLRYILDREGGFDSEQDWMDVLSGGEKQRVAMARLFYHAPQFAILDECTSAVSVDVEGSMYQYCKQVGITLFTVSHRKSLWKHHEYYLQFDGRGQYKFESIGDHTDEFGS